MRKRSVTAAPGDPVPLSDRVRQSRERLVKRGGCKIPAGFFQPGPAEALEFLHRHGYDPTRVGCMARALEEAAARLRQKVARKSK